MRINYDCLRAILIYVADNLEYVSADPDNVNGFKDSMYLQAISSVQIANNLNMFTKEDIWYTGKKMGESGLVEYELDSIGNTEFWVSDITPAGHELLSSIENESRWKKIKEKIDSVGNIALPIFTKLAADVLKQQFFP